MADTNVVTPQYYQVFMEISESSRAQFESERAREDHLILHGLEASEAHVRDVETPVYPFFAMSVQEAQAYVTSQLPYFQNEDWSAEVVVVAGLDDFYNGYVIRKNHIELQLLEIDIENIEQDDIDQFFPVLCNIIGKAIMTDTVPDRIILMDPLADPAS